MDGLVSALARKVSRAWVMRAASGSFGCAIRKSANRSAQDDRLGGWARSGFFPFTAIRVSMTNGVWSNAQMGDWALTMGTPGGGVKVKSDGGMVAFSSMLVKVKSVTAPSVSSIFIL